MTETAAPQEASQLVMKNVAELAQRQQARELGSSLARQIFRLLKVVQFHALDNMAVLQQLDQTVDALRAFGRETGESLTLLFAKSTVFVCGQLLKASRADYEAALELSQMVRRLGVTQLTIQTDAERADLTALARLFQPPHDVKAEHGVLEPSPRVRLRYVSAARLDENDQQMSPEDQILRTYATSVVVMRRVYENLMAARYQLPNQAKRLAQRLVTLSEGETPAFLGVTAMRTLNHDAAGRAVNRSILAVAMGRQLTGDLATLSRIAMSALFFDVAKPLVTGSAGKGHDVVVARMTPAAEKRLPAATASVLTALGQLRDASMVRTVIAYEAHCLRLFGPLEPMYDGAHKPMVAARIVATANRFDELMQTDLAASQTPTVDDALAKLQAEARDAVDRAMLVLLVAALGVFPRGTPVELSTGEKAVVLRTPDNPADYPRPQVRLVHDAHGQPLRMKVALDLASDPNRQILRVITDPDPLLLQACHAVREAAAPAAPASAPPEPDEELALLEPLEPPELVPEVDPTLRPAGEPVPESAPPQRQMPSGVELPPESASPQRRIPSGVELPPDSASPQRRLSSAPEGIPGSVRIQRRRASLIEVVEERPSRRDPRSDDYEPDPNDAPPPRPRPSLPLPPRQPSAPQPPQHDEAPPELELQLGPVEPSDPSSAWRRAPAALAPAEGPDEAGPGEGTHAPSASGSLERTPFSNVLLYILERSLAGTLILTEPAELTGDAPIEHAVFFQDGIPTKAHTGARVAALGPLLVAYGVLDQSQLESDPISQPPIHEATLESELLESGLARHEQIAEVRNEQLTERLCFLFGLPPATQYAFYNGFDLLAPVWGEVPGVTSPLGVLTRGLRERPEEAAMDRLLTQLGGARLELHEDSDLMAFDFSEQELAVAAAIQDGRPSVPDLIEAGQDPDVVRRVVYELMLTQCITPLT
ncbi:MAG: hypothetical protein AMXMBFR56_72090 [Polyangiaceae bacterium]